MEIKEMLKKLSENHIDLLKEDFLVSEKAIYNWINGVYDVPKSFSNRIEKLYNELIGITPNTKDENLLPTTLDYKKIARNDFKILYDLIYKLSGEFKMKRKLYEMTQIEVAKKIGVTSTFICNFETCNINITTTSFENCLERIKKIVEYGINIFGLADTYESYKESIGGIDILQINYNKYEIKEKTSNDTEKEINDFISLQIFERIYKMIDKNPKKARNEFEWYKEHYKEGIDILEKKFNYTNNK